MFKPFLDLLNDYNSKSILRGVENEQHEITTRIIKTTARTAEKKTTHIDYHRSFRCRRCFCSYLLFAPHEKSISAYANQSGPSVGDPNAPIIVEQFSNFTCSHCRNFALESEADFIKNYVDTGKVYLTYYNFQFSNDESVNGAEAAYCAGEQNSFFEYKKSVYLNVQFSGAFAENNIQKYARDLDLNMDEFNECLESDRMLEVITQSRDYAQEVGAEYTPMFRVNGQLVFANELNDTIDNLLANAAN